MKFMTRLGTDLLPTRTDKLIYIYMNRRVLDRLGDHYRWDQLEDEEMVQLEDLLMAGDGFPEGGAVERSEQGNAFFVAFRL